MRIAVIGAGWYGCHIAIDLLARGHAVEIFEAGDDVFAGASGRTQNRLHLGFHYPRSAQTRIQTREGYSRFKDTYPTLRAAIPDNIYAIAARDSLLDAETYRAIAAASGLELAAVSPEPFGLVDVSAAYRVAEELLLTDAARALFRERLQGVLRLGRHVRATPAGERVEIEGEQFDWVVDCSWGATIGSEVWDDVFFEPCITLLYECPDSATRAITLVDGPFFSVYPHRAGLSSVTSVVHTPLARCADHAHAKVVIAGQRDRDVTARRVAMEAQVRAYWPQFADRYGYVGPFFSIKTKQRSGSDARTASVRRVGRCIHVLSGKIDAIFEAAREVGRLLCASS